MRHQGTFMCCQQGCLKWTPSLSASTPRQGSVQLFEHIVLGCWRVQLLPKVAVQS